MALNPQVWPWEAALLLHADEKICERQRLFEKPLTPSDVGKLNRLVIPKQQAERYFPLATAGDCSAENGLLLSFLDEAGSTWRFRYSYWTSSQSYVLTKGWSRFVKEKNLHAGDVVFFERQRTAHGVCFFSIGCRHHGGQQDQSPIAAAHATSSASHLQMCTPSYEYHLLRRHTSDEESQRSNAPSTPEPAATTRLRLFGVNLECPRPNTLAGSLVQDKPVAHMAFGYTHHKSLTGAVLNFNRE